MEDRAISLNAALEAFADYVASGYADSAEDFGEYSRILQQLPSVTPQRPTGLWIGVSCNDAFGGDYEAWMAHGNPIAYHYCSECKDECYIDEDGKEILSDFCPCCGADMRGDDNEDND